VTSVPQSFKRADRVSKLEQRDSLRHPKSHCGLGLGGAIDYGGDELDYGFGPAGCK
jgi:hypothetical protein